MVAAVETMAYAGAVPWHKEGNKVEENIPIEEFQREAGLDWTVSKRPVQYSDDKVFKDRFVLARDTDDRPFAVVSGRYKPHQPKELLSTYKLLADRYGMKLHTAGALRGGSKIWALAETGRAAEIMGVPLRNYMNVVTSYDLSMSTMAYFTSIYVVCENTLQASFGDMQNKIVIPHYREFDASSVQEQMGLGEEQWNTFVQACEVLSKIKLDSDKARQILNVAYQIPEDFEKAMQDSDRVHVQNVYDLFTKEKYTGADISAGTMWGLLNAQTDYIDHHKRARSSANRVDSAWYGDGFGIKQRTFDELMKEVA